MEVQRHELLFNYCNADVEVPAAGGSTQKQSVCTV